MDAKIVEAKVRVMSYDCTSCGRPLKSPGSLRQHLAEALNKGCPKYRCPAFPKCGRGFLSWKQAAQHCRTCTDVKHDDGSRPVNNPDFVGSAQRGGEEGQELLQRERAVFQREARARLAMDDTRRRLEAQLNEQLKVEFDKLEAHKSLVEQQLDAERAALEEERAELERERLRVRAVQRKADERVTLNLGGTLFVTSIGTLTRSSAFFEAFFSPRWGTTPDADGHYFFDRNGSSFERALDFMRTGVAYLDDLPAYALLLLQQDADYFQLEKLSTLIQSQISARGDLGLDDDGVTWEFNRNGSWWALGSEKVALLKAALESDEIRPDRLPYKKGKNDIRVRGISRDGDEQGKFLLTAAQFRAIHSQL